MATIKVEKLFYFVLCTLCVTSCLKLLTTSRAKPLPTNETVVKETNCYCNGTNLTMKVDGHFLHKWLKFNTNHGIRHLSEAAGNLIADTNDLQVSRQFLMENTIASQL